MMPLRCKGLEQRAVAMVRSRLIPGVLARGIVGVAGILMVLGLLGTPGQAASPPKVATGTGLQALDQRLYELATARPEQTSVHAWSLRPDRLVLYVDSVARARGELSRMGLDLSMVEFAPARKHAF